MVYATAKARPATPCATEKEIAALVMSIKLMEAFKRGQDRPIAVQDMSSHSGYDLIVLLFIRRKGPATQDVTPRRDTAGPSVQNYRRPSHNTKRARHAVVEHGDVNLLVQ